MKKPRSVMRQSYSRWTFRKWVQDAPGHGSLNNTLEVASDLCCLSSSQQPAGPQLELKTPALRTTRGRGKGQGGQREGHRPAQIPMEEQSV